MRKAVAIRKGKIGIKPITDDYIESIVGMTGTKGRLLQALRDENAKERYEPPDPVDAGR